MRPGAALAADQQMAIRSTGRTAGDAGRQLCGVEGPRCGQAPVADLQAILVVQDLGRERVGLQHVALDIGQHHAGRQVVERLTRRGERPAHAAECNVQPGRAPQRLQQRPHSDVELRDRAIGGRAAMDAQQHGGIVVLVHLGGDDIGDPGLQDEVVVPRVADDDPGGQGARQRQPAPHGLGAQRGRVKIQRGIVADVSRLKLGAGAGDGHPLHRAGRLVEDHLASADAADRRRDALQGRRPLRWNLRRVVEGSQRGSLLPRTHGAILARLAAGRRFYNQWLQNS